MADRALYDLLSWMSPAWPIGSFAYSGGLEWAVEAGHVTGRASTAAWLEALLVHGSLRNDAVLFVHAWRAAEAADDERLGEIAELAAAACSGGERRLETTAQGAAFRRIALSACDPSPMPRLLAAVADEDLAYPVAAAVLCACHDIALQPALTAWLHGAVANLVSAAQRLVPLGQTDGQRIIRDLRAPVFAAVAAAVALPAGDPFDALGSCALVAELGGMAHETQYTRLFRT